MKWMRVVMVASVLTLMSCDSDENTGPAASGIASKITGVQTATGVTGTVKTGSVPEGTGPALTVANALSVINGGTATVPITGAASFQRIAIAIDGIEDFYELFLPAGTTTAQLFITFAQSLPEGTLPLLIAAADANVNYGPKKSVTATVTKVGAGEVQISVSWDSPSDVDLHVITPSGDEIYYGNQSAAGGTLDLDSNAGCSIDNVNNENVTWPSGASPSGTYTVLVDYWSSCDAPLTNYVVTINVAGRASQVFQGNFNGDGDNGGAGSGRLIATFTK
jgi:hypothetical protein